MQRREFITWAGGAAAGLWPLGVGAQPTSKFAKIGLLNSSTSAAERPRRLAFIEQLGKLGWIEGQNLKIEERSAGGIVGRVGELVADFVQLKVDIMVMAGDAQVLAAKNAAPDIPIVIASAGDPVGFGLVVSLARPGGNITGFSVQLPDTAGKRIELICEVVSGSRRLAILGNSGNPAVALELRAAEAAANKLGLDVVTPEFRQTGDISRAFDLIRNRVDALYVCVDPLMIANRTIINGWALAMRLPVVHSYRDNLEGGGLISFGPDLFDLYRRAAGLVDKILRGTKPADIPVEQPTKFQLVVDLKTAGLLDITVPPTLLVRADEVIE